MQERHLRGEGPWEFEAPALAPDETYRLDLRNMKYNGRTGYFRPHLPLDDALVVNTDDGNTIRARINNEYSGRVQPNTERPFEDAGVTYLTVTNIGSAEIADGSVVIELSKRGYTADDAARENASKGILARAASDLLPGL